MLSYCVRQRKRTECVPNSETFVITKNGRNFFFFFFFLNTLFIRYHITYKKRYSYLTLRTVQLLELLMTRIFTLLTVH